MTKLEPNPEDNIDHELRNYLLTAVPMLIAGSIAAETPVNAGTIRINIELAALIFREVEFFLHGTSSNW